MLSSRSSGTIGLAVLLLTTGLAPAQGPKVRDPRQPPLNIPSHALAANYREPVKSVVTQPTIVARAAPEEFTAGIYRWLLDHPDRCALAWQRLGIPCAEVHNLGLGRYGWRDEEGTEVSWLTVAETNNCRVWYAEGRAMISPRLPTIAVKAVAVLRFDPVTTADGTSLIRHQTDVYLQTDSKAAALVAKLLGPAMPRLAEQGAGQLLLFFSGLTRYFEKHPQDVQRLLVEKD